MREVAIKKCMNVIKKNSSYDEMRLSEIRYGLESIYILVTKSIVIFASALLLGILKELIIFTIFYNFIRMPSFGLHATKSWICMISSLIIFLIIPFLCKVIILNNLEIYIIGIISIIFLFKNSPADTYKRPIVNKKRRLSYKLITTIVASLYIILALVINTNFLSNALLFSLILQVFMTSPTIYKLFKLPYNNYKTYINNGLNI